MSIEADLDSLLRGDATLSGLIGERVFPVAIPQGEEMPAVVYEISPGNDTSTLGGRSGLQNAIVTFAAWAMDYDKARAVARRVAAILNTPGYFKAVSAPVFEDVFDEELERFGAQLGVSVWYYES